MVAKNCVLISCHTSDITLVKKIADALTKKGYDHLIMTENNPVQCRLREQAVEWAEVVVILLSSNYQHNQTCMQIAHDAKDCRKPITAVLAQPNYHPTGALGIISFAGGDRIDLTEVLDDEFPQAMHMLEQDIKAKIPSKASGVAKPPSDTGFRSKFGDMPRGQGTGIFVSYQQGAGAKEIAVLIRDGQGISKSLSQVKITLGSQTKDNIAAIKMCKTFVAIVTPGYQESTKCENEFECARAGNKVIIPVKVEHKFCPSGWLAIGIAGMLCHEIHDNVHAYAPNPYVPNTNPMNDLVEAMLAPVPLPQEKLEAQEIAAIQKESLMLKSKLRHWPPRRRPSKDLREMPVLSWDDLVPVDSYDYRKSKPSLFSPPKPLVDIQGQPLDQEFDVMLSYQIDTRPFVQDMYEDLERRGFKPWMAFTGMRGNLYTAMATAIEQSHVFVAFLTEKYQKGLNLALPYALSKNKPIIFVKAQPDLVLKDWIKEIITDKLVFQMSSISSAMITDYGISRMDRLSVAIRLLSKWDKEQEKVKDDVSVELFKEREQLENAQYWVRVEDENSNQNEYRNGIYRSSSHNNVDDNQNIENNGNNELPVTQRLTNGRPGADHDTDGHCIQNDSDIERVEPHGPKCTQCGAKYVEHSKYGCKRHSKYYREGTLIIGKWMCCDKRGKNAPGCIASNHTMAERVWVKQSAFEGTDCYNWVFKF